MANTAFDHVPALQVPSSTTQYGLVTWDANDGGGFLSYSSTLTLYNGVLVTLLQLTVDHLRFDGRAITSLDTDGNITITPNGTGTVVISKASTPTLLLTNSANSNAITLNTGTTAANYTITMPTAAPTANDQVLKTSGGGAYSQLVWGTAGGGGSPGGSNTHVQFNDSSSFEGSANFTWDASTLAIRTAGTANTGLRVEAYTTSNYPARLVLQKSNNATKGSHTTLEANEILGAIDFLASDGNSFELGARIRVDSISEWSASNRGSKMRFYTVPDGATGEVLALTLNEDGSINKPKNPCFGTRVTTTISNITGNHDGYVIAWDTELWDYGDNLSGSTFTAPVDGIYWFEAALTLTGIDDDHDEGYIRIKTTSSPWLEYINYFDPWGVGVTGTNSLTPISITCMMDLNAGQGVVVDLKISNGSKTVDINGSTNIHSRWEGMLVA